MKSVNTIFSLHAITFNRILRAFISLLIAGSIVGLFHTYDTQLAGFLLIISVISFILTNRKKLNPHRKFVLIAGMVLTGILGIIVELWGITNEYWTYHDLADNRYFARWLPFAWMLAFVFLYRIAEFFIDHFRMTSLKSKLLVEIILATILPTFGEIITINLGVWTYYWGYQFFGVPLLAILLLTIFHTGIFLLLTLVCRKGMINDTVFGLIPKIDTKLESTIIPVTIK